MVFLKSVPELPRDTETSGSAPQSRGEREGGEPLGRRVWRCGTTGPCAEHSDLEPTPSTALTGTQEVVEWEFSSEAAVSLSASSTEPGPWGRS